MNLHSKLEARWMRDPDMAIVSMREGARIALKVLSEDPCDCSEIELCRCLRFKLKTLQRQLRKGAKP